MKIHNGTNGKTKRKLCALAAVCLTLLIFFSAAGNIVFVAEAAAADGNYRSDYKTKAEATAGARADIEEIYGDGVTMLKNEDNALPLPSGAKISIFGRNSNQIWYSGMGGNLGAALTAEGFSVNPTLVAFYNSSARSGGGRDDGSGNGNNETPLSMYANDTGHVEDSYESYNDAALLLFGRRGGESWDQSRRMGQTPGARNADDHNMQLDDNEAKLVKYVGDRFSKVILLLNTGSEIECGFLDDTGHYAYHQNIKAALWIGTPGDSGFKSLAKILNGKINPSGRTVDTWSRDFKADPTWQNFGNNLVSNGNQYTNMTGLTSGTRHNFVRYEEGIYVGYRYYETRGFTEGAGAYTGSVNGTTTTAWENWHKAHVVYPFGYGLSYSAFQWEIVGKTPADGAQLSKGGTVSVDVKVTNKGSRPGKEVVELYYTAPYNAGGIEKAHVVLGAFEKTKLLAPEASDTLTLTMKVRDMASYDYSDANGNGFKGYELETGNYKIKIMRNAHVEEASIVYTIPDGGYKYEISDETQNTIENQFDEVSNHITNPVNKTGEEGLGHVYLSRADWANTWPVMASATNAPQWVVNKVLEWLDTIPADSPDKPYYTAVTPKTGNGTPVNGVMLKDLIGLDYDDEKWDSFLDQWTLSQMGTLVSSGSYGTAAVTALGVPKTANADSPMGWQGSPTEGAAQTARFMCEAMLAATWNKEMAYKKGRAIGNEGLFGRGEEGSRYDGYYAPAVNIHRSQFGGRNFEYYSEDGLLSGMMAANQVIGAKEKGVFCYVKHFSLNEQETNRTGLVTWANEQSMREIYFKPFELCVKVGKTTGIMSSLNRIGPVWTGGSYPLLTNVLRKEWGFKGVVVTDSFLSGLSNANQMIRAGGDLALGNTNVSVTAGTNYTMPVITTYLRNATHGICYTVANSMAMSTCSPGQPLLIKSYTGSTLAAGMVGTECVRNIGTAVLNQDEFDEPADDSLIRYSLKDGNVLPAGLTLGEDGLLSGVPEAEGTFYFTIIAAFDYEFNGLPETFTVEATFKIVIVTAAGAIIYEGRTLDPALLGKDYSVSVADAEVLKPAFASDDWTAPPIIYQVKNGSALPYGLTLSTDGTISGTPTRECLNYTFTVTAGAAGYRQKEASFSISILNEQMFTGGTLKQGKFGIPYLDRITPAVSVKQATYTLKDGSALPKGLTLTKTGYITGTPSEVVADKTFIVLAVADYCVTQEAVYKISVSLTFNDTVLADGKEGEEYYASIDTAQGAAEITYSLKAGSVLPEGLTLSSGGEITGTPVKAGVYNFSVAASSEGLQGDEIAVQLYVANASPKGSGGGCSDTTAAIASMGLLSALSLIWLVRKKP